MLFANIFVLGASESLVDMVADEAFDEVASAVVVLANDGQSSDVEDDKALSGEGAEGAVADGLPCWSVPI